jgi:alpha-galactosidase/6-phospho-beta-glucosidase family protein
MMLIFANPVPIFSVAVTNYTKIKALGICAGFGNHRWALPRICGRNRYESEWHVVAAGVNHLSFIQHGKYKELDMDEILREYLIVDWQPMPIPGNYGKRVREGLQK